MVLLEFYFFYLQVARGFGSMRLGFTALTKLILERDINIKFTVFGNSKGMTKRSVHGYVAAATERMQYGQFV